MHRDIQIDRQFCVAKPTAGMFLRVHRNWRKNTETQRTHAQELFNGERNSNLKAVIWQRYTMPLFHLHSLLKSTTHSLHPISTSVKVTKARIWINRFIIPWMSVPRIICSFCFILMYNKRWSVIVGTAFEDSAGNIKHLCANSAPIGRRFYSDSVDTEAECCAVLHDYSPA